MPLYKLTEKTKPPVFPLPCAHSWGEDQYGLWITVSIAGVDQTFRWCPPGEFMMGSPEDEPKRNIDERQRRVYLTKGYWVAETACPQKLWTTIMKDNPSYFISEEKPVEGVSYGDCLVFLNKINDEYEKVAFRLLTEAEWEYSCRAGTKTYFSFGNSITSSQINYDCDSNEYNFTSSDLFREETVQVKTLPCNDWGLYEMHGNVWEWCIDGYCRHPQDDTIDPVLPVEINSKSFVMRGGSWFSYWEDVRSAVRECSSIEFADFNTGFRFIIE